MKKRSGKTVGGKPRVRVRAKRSGSRPVPSRVNAVFLVGFMGAGKSSVGRALGERLNWIFEDLDDRIERAEGQRVSEIFRDAGEAEFRRAEHAALEGVIQELQRGSVRVIALGGGAFVQKQNVDLLEESRVPTVFLDAPVEELWDRCCTQASQDGTDRPLLKSWEQFRDLYEVRRKIYARARLTVQTGGFTVEEVADQIARKLGLKQVGIRTEEGEVE